MSNPNLSARHIAVIGIRCGDEGKGARVIYLIDKAVKQLIRGNGEVPLGIEVMGYRWHGGANAGHTVIVNGITYKLHSVPVSIVIPGTYSLLGSGMFVNPRKVMQEIKTLEAQGLQINPNNLGIASNSFVTFDFHTNEDIANLEKAEHTSTGNGIKQTAMDKYGRVGVRFAEFLDEEACIHALEKRFPNKRVPGFDSLKSFVESYKTEREFLTPFMTLQSDALKKYGLYYKFGEGAHGGDIDVEEGLYPGITSSHPAIVPHRPDIILGAMKLYDSSVGHDRPFVSRLNPELEASLRNAWGERGTTTGKDRKIGWTDLVSAKHIIEVSGVDYLVGNCGDRLEIFSQMKHKIGLVTGYKINGKVYSEWDASFHKRQTLHEVEPVIEWFEPWDKFQVDGKLHPNAQRYIDRIQEFTGREFAMLGTGPGIDDVIELKDVFELAKAA